MIKKKTSFGAQIRLLRHPNCMDDWMDKCMDNPTIGSPPSLATASATGLEILRGLKVVLVDDEPGVLRALTLLLEALACEVSAFNSPTNALTHLLNEPAIDLIISDMRMPQISGAQLLRDLRRSGASTPFILMSGHATNQEIQEAYLVGLQGFISKPFTPAQLAELVAKVLGREREGGYAPPAK